MTKLLLSVPEAAEVLSISRAKAYQMTESGSLPSFKIGSRTVVPLRALEEWIAKQVKGEEGRDDEDDYEERVRAEARPRRRAGSRT